MVNGKEVLSATDGDLKQGTVGFFGSGGGVRWDNVTVRPLK